MSEYQYYAFQAVDRPLTEADRAALRALSTRAQITATHFTNSYQWGDFKGDPANLMERWFDLHLYLANWGTRRLMMRVPKRLLEVGRLDSFLGEVDWVTVRVAGENLILDIFREEEPGDDDGDDGSDQLAALAPLRADLLAGDLRLFYLLWLTAVEAGTLADDAPEPLPGIGPLTGALEAFAAFFDVDPDLVAAAAERSAETAPASPDAVRAIVAALGEGEKTDLLTRLAAGDAHVSAELRALVRHGLAPDAPSAPARTVGELRARADAIRLARERASAEKADAERRRQAVAAERARRARLDALQRRGESVWGEIEAEIERRNAGGYDRAAALLHDLRALAAEQGTGAEFGRRLQAVRERHSAKLRFLERLTGLAGA